MLKGLQSKRPSFTLLEIVLVSFLVAVTVLLGTRGINSLNTRARDLKRLADIKDIQAAAMLYRQQVGTFPAAITPGEPLISPDGTQTYMSRVPDSPECSECDNAPHYSYASKAPYNSYSLKFTLEGSTSNYAPGLYKVAQDNAPPVLCTQTCVDEIPPPNTYTLTYGAGIGGSISGITSQSVSSGNSGKQVTAIPSTGYVFDRWSDGRTSVSRVDSWVHANVSVAAIFRYNTYTLSYHAGSGGTISGSSTQDVAPGDSGSEVRAVPDSGYHFSSWSDNPALPPYRTDSSVQANMTVTANFAVDDFILSYSAGPGGSISGSSTQAVAPGGKGTPVIAMPDSDHNFSSWQDTNSLVAARQDTNVSGNISATANFVLKVYTLAYSAGSGGHIDLYAMQQVNAGTDGHSVTAIPDAGYHFTGWNDGGTDATRTDTSIHGNVVVSASFSHDNYILHYYAGAGGALDGDPSQSVTPGGSGTQVTALPDGDHDFFRWSDTLSTVAARTDGNVNADVSATATFNIKVYSLAYTTGSGGSIIGNTMQSVNAGSYGATVTATPATHFHFTKWDDEVATATRTDGPIHGNKAVVAYFAANAPDYTLAYSAGTGGSLSGDSSSSQAVYAGDSGSQVTAVADSEYAFWNWSDAVATAARTDTNVQANKSVTASFKCTQNCAGDFGTGNDGSVTISGSKNINTDTIAAGRTCADGVSYSVTALTANTAALSSSPAAGCLAVGDEMLLMNLQGLITTYYSNVGAYEFLRIASVSGNVVTFSSNKVYNYGNNSNDDTNIGTAVSNQRVVLQRVPNYLDVTINGSVTLFANGWNGTKGGILAFKAAGTVINNGYINMSGYGYRGGGSETTGEGFNGAATGAKTVGPYAGSYSYRFAGNNGCLSDSTGGGGGGGGYGTGGTDGQNSPYYYAPNWWGGTKGYGFGAYGPADLNRMYMGGGGGGGGKGACNNDGSSGGNSGGMIYVAAYKLVNTGGYIMANGATSAIGNGGTGGGGSGGAIKLLVYDSGSNLGSGRVITNGGAALGGGGWCGGYPCDAYTGGGGAGGNGRTAVYYKSSVSGSTGSSAYAAQADLGFSHQ